MRIELSKLSEAGMLQSHKQGQKVIYRPNIENPFYHQITSIVAKHMGIDALVERVIDRIGDLEAAYLLGDYALGIDSGTMELALVGDLDQKYAEELAQKESDKVQKMVDDGISEAKVSLLKSLSKKIDTKDFPKGPGEVLQ